MNFYNPNSKSVALILGLVCMLAFGQLRAEHEADHRYNVRGYLLDSADRGITGQEVAVFGDGDLLGSSKTDAAGYYSINLHLHDEDLGRKLTLRAGSRQAQLRVKFDPADKSTHRIHEANFVDGEFVEGDLGRFRLPPWIYPLAGLIVIGMVLVTLEKRRRAKIRKKAIAAGSAGGKSRGKKRRRKR